MAEQNLIILLFILTGFTWLGLELRGQRLRLHELTNKFMDLYATQFLITLGHEERLSKMEGSPFRPAELLERIDKETRDKMALVLQRLEHR